MADMMAANQAVDIVTLCQVLEDGKELHAVGDRAYLFSLTEGLPRRLSIAQYVGIVRDNQVHREAIRICSAGITRADDQSEEAAELVADVDRQLLEIVRSSASALLVSQTSAAFEELAVIREGVSEPAISTSVERPMTLTKSSSISIRSMKSCTRTP